MLSTTDNLITDTVEEIYQRLSDPEGKQAILNPQRNVPILDVNWTPNAHQNEVNLRVDSYIQETLKSKLFRVNQIENEIRDFYHLVCQELKQLEKEWISKVNDLWKAKTFPYESDQGSFDVPTRYIPLYTILGTVGLVIFTLLSPALLPVWYYKEQKSNKQRLVDEAYSAILSTVQTKVTEKLDSGWSQPLKKTIDEVTDDVLSMLEKLLEKRNQELQIFTEKLTAIGAVLKNLESQVNEMEEIVLKLHVK